MTRIERFTRRSQFRHQMRTVPPAAVSHLDWAEPPWRVALPTPLSAKPHGSVAPLTCVSQPTSDEPSREPFIPAESPVDPDASRIGTRLHSFGSGARHVVVPTCTPDAKARHRLWRSAFDRLVRRLSLRQCAVYRGLATAPFVRTVTRATAPSGDGRLGLPRYSGTMFTRSDVSRRPDRRGGEE